MKKAPQIDLRNSVIILDKEVLSFKKILDKKVKTTKENTALNNANTVIGLYRQNYFNLTMETIYKLREIKKKLKTKNK